MAERSFDILVDKGQPGYTYIGSAPPGTPEEKQAWQIIRVSTTGGVKKTYAENNPEYVHIWENRYTYAYS